MRFVSLFAGIGGLDLGLERAGWTCVAQVELDEFCRAILARHWPDVPRFADVRDVRAEDLGAVDALVGGFPCQDISAAGKGAGLDGERSGLWFEFARLVREVRPAWVVVENVPALRTRGADRVLEDLESCGYACRALVVGADDVGAPHRRKRVFVVADSDRERCGRGWKSEPRGIGGSRGNVVDRRGARRPARTDDENAGSESGMGRGADGVPGGMDRHRWPAPPGPQNEGEPPRTIQRERRNTGRRPRLKALGNAVVPQVAEAIGRAILSAQEER